MLMIIIAFARAFGPRTLIGPGAPPG